MSVLAYQTGELEIFQNCNKECGIITASDDQQYFSLNCLFCSEKFLYFDAFITHIQTDHASLQKTSFPPFFGGDGGARAVPNNQDYEAPPMLDEAQQAMLEPQMVMVKEERMDDVVVQHPFVDDLITGMPSERELADAAAMSNVKHETYGTGIEMHTSDGGASESYFDNDNDYPDPSDFIDNGDNENEQDAADGSINDDDDYNDDDLLEEALLDGSDVTMHIKDRKMIQFLIDSYKRNPFLWDQRHPKFRCRMRRANFLNYIVNEFKRRFNVTLAKDAVTRKWDNLRTVYKRECNRMSKEQTNISTLWYFKELHFLNFLYGGNQQTTESIIQESTLRRRFSSLWNEESTNKLLYLVSQYPCFWDKFNVNYRSKERRGEALQYIVSELQAFLQVSPIQISKRMSQLRFDYSKQKQERFQCEQNNKTFIPNFTYYEQMQFMDHDILPFKCEFCSLIFNTTREFDLHLETHSAAQGYVCSVCHMSFNDAEQFHRHKRTHLVKELKYHCEMCAASFKEKSNYIEHMRRHTNEMRFQCNECSKRFMNGADLKLHMRTHVNEKPYICDICGKPFANSNNLAQHRAMHTEDRHFKCDYAQCGKTFLSRQFMLEHMKMHFTDEEHKCEVCGKIFKSYKNLQNHKQIHDAIKKYVCKICGSAFAQAAGLYLHKRRHNRNGLIARKTNIIS